MDLKRTAEKVFMHFDDQLGVFSATGSGLAGAGLVAMLMEPGNIISAETATFLTGLSLIVLDYFR